MRIRFNCEVVRAETGEEQTYNWQTRAQVVRLIGNMEDGDAVVVNAVEELEGEL